MDKLFGMLGMVMVGAVIKVRTAAETLLEFFRGEDGFLMMVGICGVAMVCAAVVLRVNSLQKS